MHPQLVSSIRLFLKLLLFLLQLLLQQLLFQLLMSLFQAPEEKLIEGRTTGGG